MFRSSMKASSNGWFTIIYNGLTSVLSYKQVLEFVGRFSHAPFAQFVHVHGPKSLNPLVALGLCFTCFASMLIRRIDFSAMGPFA